MPSGGARGWLGWMMMTKIWSNAQHGKEEREKQKSYGDQGKGIA